MILIRIYGCFSVVLLFVSLFHCLFVSRPFAIEISMIFIFRRELIYITNSFAKIERQITHAFERALFLFEAHVESDLQLKWYCLIFHYSKHTTNFVLSSLVLTHFLSVCESSTKDARKTMCEYLFMKRFHAKEMKICNENKPSIGVLH